MMKTRKKLIALSTAICLAAGLMPATAFAAEPGTNKAIQIGTGGIKDPTKENTSNPTTAKSGQEYIPNSYIYFGMNNGEAIKWRVLDADKANDKQTDGMFLLSEYLLNSSVKFNQDYHTYNDEYHKGKEPADKDHTNCVAVAAYQGSDAQAWVNSFASNEENFSVSEQTAMLGIAKTDAAEDELFNTNWDIRLWGESSLTAQDKMFFLSVHEAADYVADYNSASQLIAADTAGNKGVWWLRTPRSNVAANVAYATKDGNVQSTSVDTGNAVRPAFNVNTNDVLFTSAAVGGKNDSAADKDLTAVNDYAGNEWKLTLLDESRSFDAMVIGVNGKTLTVLYSGAAVGANEYISAIVKGRDDTIKYYGRIAQPAAADGQATIDLSDAAMENGDKLYVFSEQYNGDYKSDYASAFAEIPADKINAYRVSADLTNLTFSGKEYAKVNEAYTAALAAEKNYILPENIEIKVDGMTLAADGYTYDPISGAISISGSAITGNIQIIATAAAPQEELPAEDEKPEDDTKEPAKPTEPTDNDTKDDTPQTGVHSDKTLWVGLLFVSGAGIALAAKANQKRHRAK